ncbi:MAG TPA: ABC transporter permease subunit [Herpetosiphonaceae bacterium]
MRAMIVKELRSYLRGARPFVLISVYLLVLGGILLLVYATEADSPFVNRSSLGTMIYVVVFGLALLQLTFLTPAMNASALGGERDRQTIDLLLVAPIKPWMLVVGKLAAPCLFLLLLSLATVPLAGIAFLIGGIELRDLLVGLLLLVLTTLSYGSIGIWAAASARSSRSSTMLAQGIVFMLAIGVPVVAFVVLGLLVNNADEGFAEWLLTSQIVRWPAVILMSLSPFVGLASWLVALESGDLSLTHTMPNDVGGGKIPVLWVMSLIVWSVLIPLLLWRSARALPRSVARSGGG